MKTETTRFSAAISTKPNTMLGPTKTGHKSQPNFIFKRIEFRFASIALFRVPFNSSFNLVSIYSLISCDFPFNRYERERARERERESMLLTSRDLGIERLKICRYSIAESRSKPI